MKVYKSLSPKNVEKPYIFPESSHKIYSYEGLVFYCYDHWQEAMEVLGTESFGYFVSETLHLKEKHNELSNILNSNIKDSKKLLLFLEESHLIYEEQLQKLQTEIDSWEALPLHIQYKKLGDNAFYMKKYVKAIGYYQRAQTISFDAIVEYNMGIAYLKLYYFQEAEKALTKAAEFSDKSEIQIALIKLLKMTNRCGLAIQKAEALRNKQASVELLLECGVLYQILGEHEKAMEVLLEAYQKENRLDIRIRLMEAVLEVNKEHPLLKGIDNLPEDSSYYLLKAKSLLKDNKSEEAIELLEEGAVKVQDNSRLYMTLSKIYRDNKQLIKAIGAVSNAAQDKTVNDEVLFEMALIAKRAGNWSDYEAKIDELLKLWKNDVRQRFS